MMIAVELKVQDKLTRLKLRGKGRAHWKRFGTGGYRVEMMTHEGRNSVSMYTDEWDDESGHTKRTMIDLSEEQALSIYQLLKGKFEPSIKERGPVELSKAFHAELLEAYETLGDIATVHGVIALTDIVYLQAAILSGEWIDVLDQSGIVQVIESLPCRPELERFLRFVDNNGRVLEKK